MKSLREELQAAGYSLTNLAQVWSLHRKTVTRIVDGHIKKDSDYFYRWLFLKSAGLPIDKETQDGIRRFPLPVSSGHENSQLEEHLHAMRLGVTDVLASIGYENAAAQSVFHIGKQIDQLASLLGLPSGRAVPPPASGVSESSVRRRG